MALRVALALAASAGAVAIPSLLILGCKTSKTQDAPAPPPAPPGAKAASAGVPLSATAATATAATAEGAAASAPGADSGAAAAPSGIRWVGRVDTSSPGLARFAWSGSGFVATVHGPRISARLQTERMTGSSFFQVVVDGRPGSRVAVPAGDARTVVLADGLAPGDHVIELYRDTEGMYGDSVFSGFVEGTLRGAPPPSGRLIEVIGDSISAGYGNLGDEKHPPWDNTCTFSLETESAYRSYASALGRALGAEVSIVARSGWGVYRDSSGSTAGVLPSIYANTVGTVAGPTWDFRRQPSAVVINLGTNDGATGDPGTPFEDAYVAFLRAVRAHNPDAWIFLTIGPMTTDPLLGAMRRHLARVAARAADPRLAAVDIPSQDPSSTGCDYHPNVAEDGVMAGILAPAIRAKLGW